MFGRKQDKGGVSVMNGVKFHAIKVKVTPSGTIPPTGEVPCDVTAIGNPGGGSVQNNKIKLDPTEGPFCIQFDLDNRLDWDADPIWIKKNNCPNNASSEPDQIWVDNTPDNGVLTIMNMNVGGPCELHYRLNFTGGRYCDPIMENGGGNIFRF